MAMRADGSANNYKYINYKKVCIPGLATSGFDDINAAIFDTYQEGEAA
jgi:hypothetical protein